MWSIVIAVSGRQNNPPPHQDVHILFPDPMSMLGYTARGNEGCRWS